MRTVSYLLATALTIGLTGCATIDSIGGYCGEEALVCAAAGAVVVGGLIYAASSGHRDPSSPGYSGPPSSVPSDARLKRDIRFAGTLENGVHVYSFRYWNDGSLFVGVLAQELLQDPRFRGAVHHSAGGYYVVDLDALDLRMVGSRKHYAAAGQHALQAAEAARGRVD